MTDAELAADLAEGLSSSQIAERRGISRQAVNKRRKHLKFQAAAVAVVSGPESTRFVAGQLDALDMIRETLEKTTLLMDASDRWLRDVDDPTRYDIGPRSEEVMVTYLDFREEKPKKAKASLQELLERAERYGGMVVGSKQTYADPRELILSTAREVRATVGQLVELAQMLADARSMQLLRETLLAEIAKADPEIAERIAGAVRRVLVLHSAAGGVDSLAAG